MSEKRTFLRTPPTSVIATIEVAAGDFALDETLAADPDIRIQLERVVPLSSTFIPYFWAQGVAVEDVEPTLRADGDVESFSIVDSTNDEVLVHVEWGAGAKDDGFLNTIAETEATILEAVGEAGTWTVQLRFPDHSDLTTFYRRCVDLGLSIELKSVHNPGPPADVGLGLGLTDAQHETLVTALEAGYFEVPRQINLTDLAAELDVSDTAISQRLRRGIASLLVATLAEPEDRSVDRNR